MEFSARVLQKARQLAPEVQRVSRSLAQSAGWQGADLRRFHLFPNQLQQRHGALTSQRAPCCVIASIGARLGINAEQLINLFQDARG